MKTIEHFVDAKEPRNVAVIGPNFHIINDSWPLVLLCKKYVESLTLVDEKPKTTPASHGNIYSHLAELQALYDARLIERMPRVIVQDATRPFAKAKYDLIIDDGTAKCILYAKEERKKWPFDKTADKLIRSYARATKDSGSILFIYTPHVQHEMDSIEIAAENYSLHISSPLSCADQKRNPLHDATIEGTYKLRRDLGLLRRNFGNGEPMRMLEITR